MLKDTKLFAFDELVQFFEEKYREVFTSLYSINDPILDENLLHYLYYDCYVVLMEDEGEHHIWSASGDYWDRYGKVIRGMARYPSELNKTKVLPFNEKNSVVIYGKRNKQSIRGYIYTHIYELATIMYNEQGNLRLSNIKGIIEGTNSQKDMLINIFWEYLRGDKHWIVMKEKKEAKVTPELNKLDLGVEYIAEKYQKSLIFYHNQILEALGINFVPIEKAERQIVDEVNANNELTMSISNKYIDHIQYRLDKYNKLKGTSFKITKSIIREDKTESQKEPDDKSGESEVNDEL